MFQLGKAHLKLVAYGSIFSLKIIPVFLCAMLVIGSASYTHADDEIKVPGLWAAVKDFWDFLSTSEEPVEQIATDDEAQDKNKQLVEIISDELSTSDGAEDLGLVELTNNPICKAIYVAEYLPTFNQQAIEKCQKLIEQEDYKILFEHYVAELCQQTTDSQLSKDQIAQIQLRLRKYSQTFPQANFQVDVKDIDGIYGSKTCQHIAFYQIASQYDVVDGQPNQLLYDQLANIIPLSNNEIENSLPVEQKPKKLTEAKKEDTTLTNKKINSVIRKFPTNSLQKDVFCVRYSEDPHCTQSAKSTAVVKLEIDER